MQENVTPDPAPSDPPTAEPPSQDPAPKDPAPSPWEDPAAAKAEIERLRRENAADRTNAKTKAAEEARAEFAQTIGKALGLVKDEPIDPAALAEKAGTAQAEAKVARVELAVFKAAATAGGDPAALLDSASFLEKVATLDPTDAAGITAAIQAAVEANPRLGVASGAPKVPDPNPAQGRTGATPVRPASLTDAISAHYDA